MLGDAAESYQRGDWDTAVYKRMRDLLQSDDRDDLNKLRPLFCSFYRMNAKGLSDEFLDAFFEYLWDLGHTAGEDPYTAILKRLFAFPRKQRTCILPCSFVSKAVALHDESRPVYDKFVGDFFGIGAPAAYWGVDLRIAGFVSHIQHLRRVYHQWSTCDAVMPMMAKVRWTDPGLRDIADIRLVDILVWRAGKLAAERTRQTATPPISPERR